MGIKLIPIFFFYQVNLESIKRLGNLAYHITKLPNFTIFTNLSTYSFPKPPQSYHTSSPTRSVCVPQGSARRSAVERYPYRVS